MSLHPARWWHPIAPDTARCELCPRGCLLKEGRTGFCGMRRMEGGTLRALVFGATSGLCVDPIEKKPLYHFQPGSRALSFGTLGCTLACDFCQNAGLSRGRDLGMLRPGSLDAIVRAAQAEGCGSVAFTYNEPIVSAEWCLEVAAACREAGLCTLAITSGYVSGSARTEFFGAMDAANVDLKSFSEAFYRRHCQGHLQPVLETLEYLAKEGRTWLEVTTLLIPGENDGEREIGALAEWIAEHLGRDIPLHFSAFHPAYRLLDLPPTPAPTLHRAREIAMARGLRFVYTGNILDPKGSATFCPGCGKALITREGFQVLEELLREGHCPQCGANIPGRFGQASGEDDPSRRSPAPDPQDPPP